jgi:hypothetical protein
MKLTKEMKNSITEKMVEKYYPSSNLKELEQKLDQFARAEAEKTVPKEVAEVFKAYPGYVEKSSRVRFVDACGDAYGEACVRVDLSGPRIPCAENFFKLPRSETALALKKDIVEYDEKRTNLASRLLEVISSCTTTKQLAEVLPEAIEFVPTELSANMLPVPVEVYEQLRRELKSLSVSE